MRPASRVVEREELGGHALHPVDVEKEPPDRRRRGRRGANRLHHLGDAGRDVALEGKVEPVQGVGLGAPVQLEHRARLLAAPGAAPLGVGEGARPPPLLGAREHARPLGCDPVGDVLERLERLVEGDEARPALPLERPCVGAVRAMDLDVPAERREPVAEARVDAGLRGPEDGERLTALVHAVELGSHELPQHPSPAMRGEDADNGHARNWQSAARNRQVELECTGAANDRVAVDGGEHAPVRQHPCDALHVLGRRRPRGAEVVGDRRERAQDLVALGDADLHGHTFSSGAYSSMSRRSAPSWAKRTVTVPSPLIPTTTPSPSVEWRTLSPVERLGTGPLGAREARGAP